MKYLSSKRFVVRSSALSLIFPSPFQLKWKRERERDLDGFVKKSWSFLGGKKRVGNSKLVSTSSPYTRLGVRWEKSRQNFNRVFLEFLVSALYKSYFGVIFSRNQVKSLIHRFLSLFSSLEIYCKSCFDLWNVLTLCVLRYRCYIVNVLSDFIVKPCIAWD